MVYSPLAWLPTADHEPGPVGLSRFRPPLRNPKYLPGRYGRDHRDAMSGRSRAVAGQRTAHTGRGAAALTAGSGPGPPGRGQRDGGGYRERPATEAEHDRDGQGAR